MLVVKKKSPAHPSIESILNTQRIKHVLSPHTGKLEKVPYTLNDMMIEALAHEKKDEE